MSYRRTKTLVIVLEGGFVFLLELEISFGELREKFE